MRALLRSPWLIGIMFGLALQATAQGWAEKDRSPNEESGSLVLELALIQASGAEEGSGFDLPWVSIDSGGGVSAGSVYRLTATVGQAEAGLSIGGEFVLSGGFLGSSSPLAIFSDGFESGDFSGWDVVVGGN